MVPPGRFLVTRVSVQVESTKPFRRRSSSPSFFFSLFGRFILHFRAPRPPRCKSLRSPCVCLRFPFLLDTLLARAAPLDLAAPRRSQEVSRSVFILIPALATLPTAMFDLDRSVELLERPADRARVRRVRCWCLDPFTPSTPRSICQTGPMPDEARD